MSLRTRTLLLITSLLVATVLATSGVLAWASRHALVAQAEADGILIAHALARSAHFAEEVRANAEDALAQQMVVEATILAHLVALGEAHGVSADELNARLLAITHGSLLDEIWITDESGHAYLRSVPEIDFTFSPDPRLQPQASAFWPLLTGARTRVVQDALPREVDTQVFKYVGVAGVDRPRIVQVGFDAGFLRELGSQVGLSRLARELVEGGDITAIRVVDEDLYTLVFRAVPGRDTSSLYSLVDGETLQALAHDRRALTRLHGSDLIVIAPITDAGDDRFYGLALVQLPADHIQAALTRQLLLAGIVVAIVLVVGALGAVLLARSITGPVARLTSAVAAIEGDKFTPALLTDVVQRKDELGHLALALGEYARLSADQVRQAIVQYELSRAWEIQSKLLPTVLDGWPGALDLAVHFRPARETSGDFYDVLALPVPDADADGPAPAGSPPRAPLQIAVADVAGKGIAAALVMALARATLRTIAELEPAVAARGGPSSCATCGTVHDGAAELPSDRAPSPATTLALTGRRLHRDVGQRDFVCCALAVVEPPRAGAAGPRLRLANGGQVPPILCRAGVARELEPPGERFPLGVLPDPDYGELVLELVPGDVVVFASDGLPEAPARPGLGDAGGADEALAVAPLPPPTAPGELFGFERLAASVVYWTARQPSAEAIAEGVWSDVTAWCGETSSHDDMTLLVLRVAADIALS